MKKISNTYWTIKSRVWHDGLQSPYTFEVIVTFKQMNVQHWERNFPEANVWMDLTKI